MPCSLLAIFCFSAWPTHTIALEAIADAFIAADAVQTSQLASQGFVERESDCIIGRHPTAASTAEYFAGLEFGHILLTNALEKISPRWADVFEGISIGWEADTVRLNVKLGVRF